MAKTKGELHMETRLLCEDAREKLHQIAPSANTEESQLAFAGSVEYADKVVKNLMKANASFIFTMDPARYADLASVSKLNTLAHEVSKIIAYIHKGNFSGESTFAQRAELSKTELETIDKQITATTEEADETPDINPPSYR